MSIIVVTYKLQNIINKSLQNDWARAHPSTRGTLHCFPVGATRRDLIVSVRVWVLMESSSTHRPFGLQQVIVVCESEQPSNAEQGESVWTAAEEGGKSHNQIWQISLPYLAISCSRGIDRRGLVLPVASCKDALLALRDQNKLL